jgi:hypothetical protein
MAYAINGGLFVATLLTLLFPLPLYVTALARGYARSDPP